MNNNVLIIAGMHRSGTSLIAGWLHTCGLHLGDRLLGVHVGNAKGHFEDLDFLDFHQQVLRNHQLPDDGLISKPFPGLAPQEIKELQTILQRKTDSRQQWGWKEPRTCLFLRSYQKLLPDACYLIIIRDFQSVVSSLIKRRYNYSIKKYEQKKGLSRFIWEKFKKKRRVAKLCRRYAANDLKAWILYNQQLKDTITNLPDNNYLVVDYESLMEKDFQVIHHLNEEWHFNLDYTSFSTVYEPELMGSRIDITPYVNESLLMEASLLESELKTASQIYWETIAAE